MDASAQLSSEFHRLTVPWVVIGTTTRIQTEQTNSPSLDFDPPQLFGISHMNALPDTIQADEHRALFRAEVLRGLRNPVKELPCKYFYDERGSKLFEQICELDEYYLTRTEMEILNRHVGEMADRLGSNCVLIELGSGSDAKTRLLLEHLREPAAYVPIDLARDSLLRSTEALRRRFPGLTIAPCCADFTAPFEIAALAGTVGRRVVYFPGSTIGNFGPAESRNLLAQIARLCGPGGGLLLGMDLKKDPALLVPAYNDREGVTAAFNLNLLERINHELGADFDLTAFRHSAVYNRELGRIEMFLISACDQVVHLGDSAIAFRREEAICTEHSYKYDLQEFEPLARSAGFQLEERWTDDRRRFAVVYLTLA
jgi:dimethylhistidine N-methyltransferase